MESGIKNKISVCKNFLSVENHKTVIEKTLHSNKWAFGRTSLETNNYHALRFWGISLLSDDFFSKDILKKININFNKNFSLVSINANGQSYGQCGNFHTDSDKDFFYTLVYFVNPTWDVNWGGSLVFFDPTNKSIHTEEFEPNKAVLFPSNILHYGSEPTRFCQGIRVSVAFVLADEDLC